MLSYANFGRCFSASCNHEQREEWNIVVNSSILSHHHGTDESKWLSGRWAWFDRGVEPDLATCCRFSQCGNEMCDILAHLMAFANLVLKFSVRYLVEFQAEPWGWFSLILEVNIRSWHSRKPLLYWCYHLQGLAKELARASLGVVPRWETAFLIDIRRNLGFAR